MMQQPPSSRSRFYYYASFLLLLLPLALLVPGLADFPYPSLVAQYSDLSLTHYPNALALRQAILQYHQAPLWSGSILSGAPLAANPLSGLWYPPGWLALLLPLPLGFNLLVMAHLLWGGLGMYALLRREGLSHGSALLGGLAFEGLPKLFAHYGAGHLTLLYAVPWTPWLLWASRSRLKIFHRSFRWTEAVVMALIFLADVRWAAYAGLLWWAYSIVHSKTYPEDKLRVAFPPRLVRLAEQTLLAGLLAAPLAVPLVEFIGLSSRSALTPQDFFTFSLPASRLLGLTFPDFGGFHEYMLYGGELALALALLACLWPSSRRRAGFWIWAAALSLLFSLGSQLPFLRWLGSIPGLDLLRVPSRALFITGISLAALAAHGADRLLAGLEDSERRRGGLLLTGLAGFILILALAAWAVTSSLPLNFVWGAAFALAAALWIGLRFAGRLPANAFLTGLLVLCLVDLWGMDRTLVAFRSPAQVLAEGQATALGMAVLSGDPQPGEFRTYSPSYSLPQQTAALNGYQLADGVDPMQLSSYVSFMQRASGVPWMGYSVTVPPFAQGKPASDNAAYRPDPALLGLLNVRYITAQFDLLVEGLVLRSKFGDTRLYENLKALPRAWVQPVQAAAGEQDRAVSALAWSPNSIQIDAQGPGLLVLSEIAYPGWLARLDGRPVRAETVAGLLRGVELPPGKHQVVWTFVPLSVIIGLGLWALGVAIIVYSTFRPSGNCRPVPETLLF